MTNEATSDGDRHPNIDEPAHPTARKVVFVESPLDPDDAFARLLDLTRVPEWDRGVSASALIDGTPGTVGARYSVGVTGFDGRPTTADYVVTAVGERTFTMVGTHPDFRAEDTVTVTGPAGDTGGGCRATYDAALTLVGDEPPLTEAQLAATFAKLAAVVEAGVTTFLAADD